MDLESLGRQLQSSGMLDKLRGAAEPAFAGKEVVPTNSGSALFVFTQDQAKREAVWEFITFVTSERGYTIITEDIGYLPLRPSLVEEGGYKPRLAYGPVRVAMSGRRVSPPLFESMEIVGKAVSIARLEGLRAHL